MTLQHYDIIIVGAGISGISAAYHVQRYQAGKTFRIFERRAKLGGTWDLFNYPGIRSDSDMYTFGFNFRHWSDDSAIAEKSKILSYLNDTVDEFNLAQHIQYDTDIASASWSSANAHWLLTTKSGDRYTCRTIFMCTGYYNYQQAHEPQFEGLEAFDGQVVHPQFWPENFNYLDKNVVIIGSGATAITMLPSMAEQAKHVTMLQRSPTYMGSKPAIDPIANRLAKWFGRWAARWWFILSTMFLYWYCRSFPQRAKAKIINEVKIELGDKFDAKHFSPNYKPWDQRVCLCPDGDFFDAIKADKASVETDHIAGFSKNGILLKSGKHLQADVIVTATGLKIDFLGSILFDIDGKPFDAHEHYVYKGMMISGVPNLFIATGYTNASWTLKVDLTNRYATRVMAHMEKRGYTICTPRVRGDMQDIPLIDLSAGYIQRSLEVLPKQAVNKPWRLNQNFLLDNLALRFASVVDKEMDYS